MTKVYEVYKCESCGNVVEILHGAGGKLVCCGKPMTLKVENSVEASGEKHIPVVSTIDGGIHVEVGSVEHPMLEEHFIEWIEVITTNKVYRKHLKPGEKPEATFYIGEEIVAVREYCNLHGLWKA